LTPTIGLEPFPGPQEAPHELLIQQHVSHGLGDDDVHHVGTADLLHLPFQDPDPLRQAVVLDQDLHRRHMSTVKPHQDQDHTSDHLPETQGNV